MRNLKLIRVENKIYSELSLTGGHVSLGNPFDVNNEVVKQGVIWEMQPFFDKIPFYIYCYINFIRYFKKDVFGRSDFKSHLISLKILR